VDPRFCWGFWQKRGAERGFLMVNLWWIAGGTWCLDGHFSGAENSSLCQDLFLRDSHFGNPAFVCAPDPFMKKTLRIEPDGSVSV
jgi:hypothetical protein